MLPSNQRQEALSLAYVLAIAARSGLAWHMRVKDFGFDLTLLDIHHRGGRISESGIRLDIQLKCTTAAVLTDANVLFDLDVKNYNDLRTLSVATPRILVVMVVPKYEETWTQQGEDALLIRHAAYWLSLKGRGSTPNLKTVRVSIPRTNLFSVENLQALMSKVRRR
ncbi:MAG TPA: DUF4365 domain-containing protein, partial [Gemmataceae bacterium]|nr:DUF4365 domain-containing protein [Gemmataceae bacterium]